jgi:hypothetical protein
VAVRPCRDQDRLPGGETSGRQQSEAEKAQAAQETAIPSHGHAGCRRPNRARRGKETKDVGGEGIEVERGIHGGLQGTGSRSPWVQRRGVRSRESRKKSRSARELSRLPGAYGRAHFPPSRRSAHGPRHPWEGLAARQGKGRAVTAGRPLHSGTRARAKRRLRRTRSSAKRSPSALGRWSWCRVGA